MPLSNEERKQLEEMERELDLDYPKLARKLRSGSPGPSLPAPALWGILTGLAGLLILILSIALKFTVLGLMGFVLMGAGAYWFVGVRNSFGRPGSPPDRTDARPSDR